MDRHLAYVGMTRRREQATLYAGTDDFKGFNQLRDRLSRARLKDSTLDYAERRGIETPRGEAADQKHYPAPSVPAKQQEPTQQADLRRNDPVERFRKAQQEFIRAAGRFDLSRAAKVRAAELRRDMKSAAMEISKNADLTREAERAGIADQVKSLAREKQTGLSKDKGFEMER